MEGKAQEFNCFVPEQVSGRFNLKEGDYSLQNQGRKLGRALAGSGERTRLPLGVENCATT